jgi:putative acyl-CoA dehydrogenase
MSHPQAVPVLNQTPPLSDCNLFATDAGLQDAVRREGAGSAAADLGRQGAAIGTAANFELGRLANRHPPQLSSFDVRGERIDALEFHPAWHALLQGIAQRGYHSGPWGTAGSHTARAAGYFMQAQVESGTLCPTTMTYGAIAAMRRDPWLSQTWIPALLSREYDARDIAFDAKRGGLIGMGMTEKQGGSDVRTNTTRAERCADGSYRITGHKWFFSAPQCDAHLVLAQSGRGLSCFFMPRRLPDGSRNAIVIQRLKDKLGNRSNASSEVEFHGAWAHLLGEEGRGVPTILEMGTYTRLDCAIGSAGLMRQALVQCLHHARHRRAFGAPLIDQPLMQSVLADLALESEAATALALRLARAFDGKGEGDVALRRVLTPAAKFWICKRGCEFLAEAMEVLGGNGYTEELPLARMAREMPVNSIWEGSGNIMCLDVLRAFGKSAAAREVVQETLSGARGRHRDFDARVADFAAMLASPVPESEARRLTQLFVTLMQAALLLDSTSGTAASAVAEGFCSTRLGNRDWGAVYGTVAPGPAVPVILDRAWRE